MCSLVMALVRRNMYERLTKHNNKVIIFMHWLVFYQDNAKMLCLITNDLSVFRSVRETRSNYRQKKKHAKNKKVCFV
jgi:hypothetical protein